MYAFIDDVSAQRNHKVRNIVHSSEAVETGMSQEDFALQLEHSEILIAPAALGGVKHPMPASTAELDSYRADVEAFLDPHASQDSKWADLYSDRNASDDISTADESEKFHALGDTCDASLGGPQPLCRCVFDPSARTRVRRGIAPVSARCAPGAELYQQLFRRSRVKR